MTIVSKLSSSHRLFPYLEFRKKESFSQIKKFILKYGLKW